MYGSEFICDRHVRILGFIPTPWICGGIMKPIPPERTKVKCEECGHEKTNPTVRRFSRVSLAVLIAGLLSFPIPVMAAPPQHTDCSAQIPYGAPVSSQTLDQSKVEVCRTAYVLLNDEIAKLPVWVAYTLTPEHALGCVTRSDAFAADNTLPKGMRAKPTDYDHSGYDIGHIAPDGDMRWDPAVERESFLLSNMTPQLPGLNRGLWKLLETAVRAGAEQSGDTFLIYGGPIYDVTVDKKIGKDQVDVPSGFYKIVIDTTTKHYTAFLFPQKGNLGNDLESVRVKLDDVQTKTGLTFPLPDGAVESDLWSYSFAKLTADTKVRCKK